MSIRQGSNLIAGSGGGVSNIDNLTITENANEEIQTIGVINQNDSSTAIKTWTGTKAEYDAITTKDANTLYNINDDTDVSLTILEALYPVGSVYITTANTCPLSVLISGSTWELVGQDRVLQGAGTRGAVGTTLNESLPNITGGFYATNRYVPNDAVNANGPFTYNGIGAETSGSYVYNDSATKFSSISFNANLASSTYQNNAPVQPDAYLVNIYRRTA